MRIDNNTEYPDPRDAISEDWIPFLERINCIPVLVPNTLTHTTAFLNSMSIEGIILTGGNNVCPSSYNEPETGDPSCHPKRDVTESTLIQHAMATGTPLIGVCRGMQMINAFFGGKIDPHLASNIPGCQHVATLHRVTLGSSKIKDWVNKDELTVNSFHNQGITENLLSKKLRSFAVADDGVVEGLFHPTLPILGIQWHPERDGSDKSADDKVFRSLLFPKTSDNGMLK